MAWRLAKSLQTLREEIKAAFPGTTIWDIGDENHQSGYSDHNPNVCCDVVCAIDVKPNGGLDLRRFVDYLIAHPHPNLRYVIYDHFIYQRKNGFAKQAYTGPNAHEEHAHVSVGNGPDGRSTTNYDNATPWGVRHNLGGSGMGGFLSEYGDEGREVGFWQRRFKAEGATVTVDNDYGNQTAAAAKWVFVNKLGGKAADYDGKAVTSWIAEQLLKRMAPPATVTPAQIAAEVAKYLKANPPKNGVDGRTPTKVKLDDINAVVTDWE